MMMDLVAAELDRVHERIAGRFARAEPRARVWVYVSGLVAGLERKNGWTLAEWAGAMSPDGMQRLLRHADWDVDGVPVTSGDYVAEELGDRDGVLIADDTGFLRRAAGGCAAAVFRHGGADGELPGRHFPGLRVGARARADRPGAVPAAVLGQGPGLTPGSGHSQDVEFATQPRQAQAMAGLLRPAPVQHRRPGLDRRVPLAYRMVLRICCRPTAIVAMSVSFLGL